MMDGSAPAADEHGDSHPPAAAAPAAVPVGPHGVMPGKEFTRTSKGLVVILLGCHAIIHFFPSVIEFVAVTPSKTIPFVWTIFTAGYFEQMLPGAIGNSLGLLFCGKDLEPVWGRKEFLKFIFLINVLTGFWAFIFAVILYYITGQEMFISTPLSGFHGALVGMLVGLKQLLPNLELPMCFFWKIKGKWMPFFVLSFSTVMAFIVHESILFFPSICSGMFCAWIYLRYFQKNPFTGLKGDPSDDFSFPSLFPDFMRPALEPVSNFCERAFCGGRLKAHEVSLPVTDSAKASRRRERGERVLEQRLAAENAAVMAPLHDASEDP